MPEVRWGNAIHYCSPVRPPARLGFVPNKIWTNVLRSKLIAHTKPVKLKSVGTRGAKSSLYFYRYHEKNQLAF